jgi:hypothetical protein
LKIIVYTYITQAINMPKSKHFSNKGFQCFPLAFIQNIEFQFKYLMEVISLRSQWVGGGEMGY